MKNFGMTTKGEEAHLFSIKNTKGMEALISDYGANLVSVFVPTKTGEIVDVVLGYDDAAGYEKGTASIGAIVGRVANRIADAQFELNGKTYKLIANDGTNALHGGKDFYNHRMWEGNQVSDREVSLKLYSPDKDQGFPGNLNVTVTYSLSEENELQIHYEAVSDQDTLLNLTNHSYFNIAGHNAGSVLDQEVSICAKQFTIADEKSIPTGELVDVCGTPMDFLNRKTIGKDIETNYQPLILGNGYDHNFVIDGTGYRKAADIFCGKTGITMEVYTDLPGVMLYTANFLDHEPGKNGAVYNSREAVCFETQYFPDAIHKEHFEGPVLKSGEQFDSVTTYKFVVGK